MTPTPRPVHLVICEQVIEDRKSRNMTLVSLFNRRKVRHFPSARISFSVFCKLTDAEGSGTIELRIVDSSDDRTVFSRTCGIHFPSGLTAVQVHLRLNEVA